MKAVQLVLLLLSIAIISSCGGGGGGGPSGPDDPPGGGGGPTGTDATALTPPGTSRDWLTKDALESETYPHSSPIHNGYFMPVGEENAALHDFSETININSRRLIGDYEEYRINGDESFKNFPDVDLSFVSHNGYLIPLNRDRQVSLGDNSFWGIIPTVVG